MKIVVDPGHGGHDPGGQSLGAPEKALALAYGLAIGKELQVLGHTVIYTRVTDIYPALSARAQLANESGADLFVSVHANASGNRMARGPWTIHAEGAKRAREYALAAQRAMVSTMGGSNAAVYPDGSGWTGGRTLAVLRQTKMPAILLELGFMTNAQDMALMEDSTVRAELCRRVAGALHVESGGLAPIRPKAPEVVRVPPTAPALNLDRIEVPSPRHIMEIAKVRGLTHEEIRRGIEVVEVLGRAVYRTRGGQLKEQALKAVIDAAADYLKGGDRAA